MLLTLDAQLFKKELMRLKGTVVMDNPEMFSCESHRMVVKESKEDKKIFHITLFELNQKIALDLLEFEVDKSFFYTVLGERYRVQRNVKKQVIAFWKDEPNLDEKILFGREVQDTQNAIDADTVPHYSYDEIEKYTISSEAVDIEELNLLIYRAFNQEGVEGFLFEGFIFHFKATGRGYFVYYFNNVFHYLDEHGVYTKEYSEQLINL